MNRKQIRKQHIVQLILLLLIVALINFIGSIWYLRIDLTEENRHSLSDTSIELLKDLDDIMYVKVYLEAEALPVDLLRLQRKVREMLNDFRRYSPEIEYEFINPFEEEDREIQYKIYKQLEEKGLIPTEMREGGPESSRKQLVFPGAILSYKGNEYPVNFLENEGIGGSDKKINKSISRVEQKFVQGMMRLINPEVKKIAFIEGHGELDEYQTMDIMISLSEFYKIERLSIDGVLGALDNYEAVVMAKPTQRVSEKDKFILDQYIMDGGKVLWLIEWMGMSMDSLSNQPSSMALIRDINMDDILFNYGVRINPDLIQDLNCLSIPITVNQRSGEPQFEPRQWYFFPAVSSENNHIINKNVTLIRTQFVSSIDTVGEDDNINKTYLLKTSPYSRTLGVPVEVSLDMLRRPPLPRLFNEGKQPIAVLLEGRFESNFEGRIPLEFVRNKDIGFKPESKPTSQIVISDGDMIRNYVHQRGERREPFQLGADRYYQQQFTPGNKEFLMNAVNYLCGDEALIKLRMRDIKLRLLDKGKVREQGVFWSVFNTVVPVIIIVLLGLTLIMLRRYKYTRKNVINKL
ncbi:MAG: gliding motility-associated ABC transporter substrate-binding protein GldG [Bacteroidota bacterium]|nr:gliding motility-associated ABC transporter substrate-binding protein GldG [Bacteroidota bacterium]